eukprot:SAG22_NODE_8136_length_680_cov_0.870912_1_plen_193_part_01
MAFAARIGAPKIPKLLVSALVVSSLDVARALQCGCVFPFLYNGVNHTECISAGHSEPWCATATPDDAGNYPWQNCADLWPAGGAGGDAVDANSSCFKCGTVTVDKPDGDMTENGICDEVHPGWVRIGITDTSAGYNVVPRMWTGYCDGRSCDKPSASNRVSGWYTRGSPACHAGTDVVDCSNTPKASADMDGP